MKSVLRKFLRGSPTIRHDMAFVLRFDASAIDRLSELEPGPRGRELSAYLPANLEWQQLNYGQGEGQLLIDRREWGIYWHSNVELAIVLHEGEVQLRDAIGFVEAVAAKLSSAVGPCQLLLSGSTTQLREQRARQEAREPR